MPKQPRTLEIFIALCSIVAITACAAIKPVKTDPAESICTKRPAIFAASPSHICDMATAMKMTPEDIDAYLLDATAMAYVFETIDKKRIGRFLDRMDSYLQPLCVNLTYNDVLHKLEMESERSVLIERIINRRLRFYGSPQPVSEFDCWMVLQGIAHQREQFGLKFKSVE